MSAAHQVYRVSICARHCNDLSLRCWDKITSSFCDFNLGARQQLKV